MPNVTTPLKFKSFSTVQNVHVVVPSIKDGSELVQYTLVHRFLVELLYTCIFEQHYWTFVCSFNREKDADWDADIRDDVLEECTKYGHVFHIHVDKASNQVCKYK